MNTSIINKKYVPIEKNFKSYLKSVKQLKYFSQPYDQSVLRFKKIGEYSSGQT